MKRKSSYKRRPRDIDYMLTVKRLPCIVHALQVERPPGFDFTPCRGRVQADHAGSRAFGHKAADDTCIPLCEGHHRERTDYRGTFKGWDGKRMRAWCDLAIAHTRSQIAEVRRIHG